jgi:hypothetical protein
MSSRYSRYRRRCCRFMNGWDGMVMTCELILKQDRRAWRLNTSVCAHLLYMHVHRVGMYRTSDLD